MLIGHEPEGQSWRADGGRVRGRILVGTPQIIISADADSQRVHSCCSLYDDVAQITSVVDLYPSSQQA